MNKQYKRVLTRIFKHDAIIVMVKGNWKTGKTNVGLRLLEDLFELGIISVAGTNIKIEGSTKIQYIEDFPTLKEFHYDHDRYPKHKGFVYDEAGKHSPKRSSMRKENVEWVKFIPELSKGRMKLICITQAEFITDSIFTKTEFTRATIETIIFGKGKYKINISSELIKPNFQSFSYYPKAKTKYSPYASAEWFLDRRIEKEFKFACCRIAKLYAIENKSSTIIANELGYKSRKPIMEALKRHIRHTFKETSEDDIENLVKEHQKNVGEPNKDFPSSPEDTAPRELEKPPTL